MAKTSIESIILRYSRRGMDLLRPHLSADFCRRAAEQIYLLPKGTIFLITGFYVSGAAETDGPLGTLTVANALKALGQRPVIVAGDYCKGLFEPYGIEVEYAQVGDDYSTYLELMDSYQPIGLLSIECCGHNEAGDYANMRGISIAENSPKLDYLFEIARERSIPTFGVGDGGNEIGMGNLQHYIKSDLSLNPCVVKVDALVIATVSNWGAYGIAAYLSLMARKNLMPDFTAVKKALDDFVKKGTVDGVFHKNMATVDGYPIEIEEEIVSGLHGYVSSALAV